MPIATLLLAAMAANADTPAAALQAPPATLPTTQQQFDAATAAFDAHRCHEAVDTFGALESRPAVAHNPQVLAVVRVRRASCLVRLDRFDEAADELQSAMPSLDADRAGDHEDLVTAHMALGRIAYLSFDYDNATREFQAARSLSTGADAYESLVWLSRSQMFDEGGAAANAAQEALDVAGKSAAIKPADLASLHTLHARAWLNQGNVAAAYSELKDALKTRGGLTHSVTLADIATRSDLAIAAMLNGDKDAARKYLAFSGAGHFDKSPFTLAVSMQPPPCGGPARLQPDDYAIVEFSINDDGSVLDVSPIYASRRGPAAAEFARAVAGWSWKPADAMAIPAFFRMLTRIELRCSTTTAHPPVLALLEPSLHGFMAQHGLDSFPEARSRAATDSQARAQLASAPVDGLHSLPALLALAGSPIVLPAERRQYFLRSRDVLAKAGAPIEALAWVDVHASEALARERIDPVKHREYLRTLLARPDVAADSRSAGALRLLIAETTYGLPMPEDAEALLKATANDPLLPQEDALRTGAHVRLASLQAARGDLAAARASYERSGLSDQQCSLVDATPSRRETHNDYSYYPQEAIEWGFEGWVMTQFDIQADGKTANQRAMVAYPPLVFVESTLAVTRHARYEQSYRPAGGLGCGGNTMAISYRIMR